MEELLTTPVTLMTARSGVVVYARRLTFDKIEVSQVPDKHSVSVARPTHASCINQEWSKLVGICIGESDQKVLAHEAQWDRETELRELRQENKRL